MDLQAWHVVCDARLLHSLCGLYRLNQSIVAACLKRRLQALLARHSRLHGRAGHAGHAGHAGRVGVLLVHGMYQVGTLPSVFCAVAKVGFEQVNSILLCFASKKKILKSSYRLNILVSNLPEQKELSSRLV